MKAVRNFLYHWLIDRSDRWYPILAVYYLTYACKCRCPYCSDGAGVPYYRLSQAILPAQRVLDLLQIVRRHCEYLVITGGEPLQHPEFRTILEGTRELRFRRIVLTTNGADLAAHLPTVANAVQDLVFSLQTLDSDKGDRWYGQGTSIHQQVIENIERAAAYPGRAFQIIISTVITPGNIADVYEVYDYARRRGFVLAACPQLVGVKAHPALRTDPRYHELLDFLIAEKRHGARIHGTVDYLRYLRELRHFSCRPFTMLVVSPTGDVFYPCLELGHFAGNLLEHDDLHHLRGIGCEKFGPQPPCDTRCHSACALGFARLLDHPISLLHEGLLWTRGWLIQKRPASGTGRVI